jgi:hypothetical protein
MWWKAAKAGQERGGKENRRIAFNDSGLDVDPDYKGKGLQLEFTVEDQGVFTMPWSSAMSYRRSSGEWPESVCAENTQWPSGKAAAVPRAGKPDF